MPTETKPSPEASSSSDAVQPAKRGPGRPRGSKKKTSKKRAPRAARTDHTKDPADSGTEPAQPVVRSTKPLHTWYAIKFADTVPAGVVKIDIPRPKGWEIPITLERRRHFYQPRGRVNHIQGSRMVSERDIRYMRLTDDQHQDLMRVLSNTSIRDQGISAAPFDDDPDSIAVPNPMMAELVTIEELAPRNWEDCWHDEYWLTLVTPTTKDEAAAVNMRSPGTPAARAKADRVLDLLLESDQPLIEAVQAAKAAGDKAPKSDDD